MKNITKQQIEQDIANKKYNPLNDLLFKFVFGKEERKEITISFLNAALGREGDDEITDIKFRNSEFSALAENEKSTRLDIFCTTQIDEKIDVEIQINNRKNIEKRTLFYWSNMYLSGHKKGQDYNELKPSITINLLNYNNFEPTEPMHSMFAVYNYSTGKKLCNDLEIHFFELKKFQKKPISELSRIERWMAYFSNKLDVSELQELGMQDSKIKDALDASDRFMDDLDERLAYVNREMALMDYKSDTEGFYRDGFADGKAEGKAEGIDIGESNLIIKMINKGLDDEAISNLTDKSVEEIREIRKNN